MIEDLQLPLQQIYRDPDRPVRPVRNESLDELVQSMAAIGLIQPVTVCREASRWLLICGERRLEAAKRLGWKRISARTVAYLPPALRSLMRAAENLHQNPMPLVEMTDALLLLKEAETPIDATAQALGKSVAWVNALLEMARDPVARALLETDRLSSLEAWKEFLTLPPPARKRLLQSDAPLSEERCRLAAEAIERRSIRCAPGKAPRGKDT